MHVQSCCEIVGVDNFETRWPNLQKKLLNSDYFSNAKFNDYEIEAKVGKG
jgi:hypothetical protein